MKKLGMIFDFNNKNLIWDNAIVPMCRARANIPKTTLSRYKMKQLMKLMYETKVTWESTEKL